MKNVRITGSSGFVGQNLIPYLKDKGLTIQPVLRKELENIQVDSLKDSDVIVHLAGKAHDLKQSSNPQEYYSVNYELTKKLFDVFLQSHASKFIFISSVKSAADSVDGILSESDKPNPQTDYGKSKLMAEKYIEQQVLPEGKSYIILRPCMIHGPGNKGNLNLLYQFVKKGIPYPLAAFKNKRSFLSIENLCFVIERIIEKESIPSGIYNVADDEALSTNEVVRILGNSLGKKAKLCSIPIGLVRLAAGIGSWLHLPLTNERLYKMTESYVVSNHKIKEGLNALLPVPSREGLRTTADSFKELK
ncbi:NAD-dependent epimerase/dehydratase family protein [Pedobacter nyackensis]|uniref:NAD-dependent epimerase/dehydratase family protein n=1 Tax=Pedobacter nyackensis TaxID=475255 RepID=UPI00292CCA2E|nr:NAD-dependent epimerase/dehydratase family protein [Pedobacter nyackensis]